MKKIISLITAAAISVSCVAVASAARVEDISSALQNDEIHIIYNDKAVEYEDAKPVNTDGRVMIPFRAALETMNANVGYDDATKTVTATKGGTTITFELLDDTIYIDNNGEKSEITMDVPMLVEDGRTYVPVRFMSNALGMDVGWNGDNETVVIMDYDEYIDKISESIPNLKKLASYDTSKFNKYALNIAVNGKDTNGSSIDLSAVLNMLMKDGKIGADGTVSLTSPDFNLDKSEFNAVLDGTILYLKTDLLNNISKDNAKISAISRLLTGDGSEWMSVDLEKLGANTAALKVLQIAASGQIPDVEEAMRSYIPEGDAQYGVAMMFASMADVYELLDDKLIIEEKEDGYTVSLNVSPEEFSKLFFGTGLGINMTSDITSERMTADVEITLGGTDGIVIKMNETATAADEDETVTVPEESKDITSLLTFPTPAIPIGQ
ncbi:MAG: copper amine oxidase N-terminal domain-containing protein [Clostridia bacterium]|nr:copper amine oxidase N-terminal domain-containing protein [Clostridia bacterium]